MYGKYRILGLIPARGGSKGIKDKNIIAICGKPLIVYTINAGKESAFIDDVVVTTDSKKIAEIACAAGALVPFMRPPELARDTSKTIDTALHAIDSLKNIGKYYDVLVLLQPTHPLRTATNIDNAIQKFFQFGQIGLASISPVKEHPILMRKIGEEGQLNPLLQKNSTCRRQDMEPYFRVNGSIYINRIDQLNDQTSLNDNPLPFLMEQCRSLDIDEPEDLVLAEYYLKNMTGELYE